MRSGCGVCGVVPDPIAPTAGLSWAAPNRHPHCGLEQSARWRSVDSEQVAPAGAACGTLEARGGSWFGGEPS